jgi:hypothetical protein
MPGHIKKMSEENRKRLTQLIDSKNPDYAKVGISKISKKTPITCYLKYKSNWVQYGSFIPKTYRAAFSREDQIIFEFLFFGKNPVPKFDLTFFKKICDRAFAGIGIKEWESVDLRFQSLIEFQETCAVKELLKIKR